MQSHTFVTLITGGSRGIGKALANEFAAAGHDLLLIARDEAKLTQVATELRSTYNIKVFWLSANLEQKSAIDQIVIFAKNKKLKIEIIVNNSASWASRHSHITNENVCDMITLNCAIPYLLIQAFIDDISASKQGGILNVGSLAGEIPSPDSSLYNASKAFLRNLTLAIRHELNPRGIRVTLLLPGLVRTDFNTENASPAWLLLRPVLACSAEVTAMAGYRGLISNRSIVIPGGMARVCYIALRLLPRQLVVRLRAFGPQSFYEKNTDRMT